ncbi:SWR1-complex protein 5 [Amniculicola lignicola CBS 123094]|uniref:SWR1-complex protein 5 n=1 Tax=Amniculicola lignicola CBS 123094 TaxID=1392246 RepID=A0A6A5W6M3_9PLEO|nr:SWR1-complex protein 5 [Amniculicola lignicola CBS 123094]
MAPIYPDEDLPDAEETYHESSDDDFNPTAVPADESSTSSDEDASIAKPTQRKRKPKAAALDDFDSGDEATIEAARKRKAKKRKGAKLDDEEEELLLSDEGGEGGLIKTRAQRKVEQKERRPLARTEGATVDVDALWAQMSAAPIRPVQTPSIPKAIESDVSKPDHDMGGEAAPAVLDEEETISMKKTYTFAGQETTEEKEVPRSSLEKYLADGWKTADAAAQPSSEADGTNAQDPRTKIRRPLRRPSRFDPNPTGYVRTLPPEYQLTWPRTTTATSLVEQENMGAPDAPKARPEKAQKLNVVDKSRLDWTGFVDKEGIAEELATHGKTKEAYLGRMEFLAGVEARREDERKKVKSTAAIAHN